MNETTDGGFGAGRDEQRLLAVLRQVRRRWFLLEWLRVVTWTALAAAAALGSAAGIGGLLDLAGEGRALLVTAAAMIVLAVVVAVAWPLRRRPTDKQVARFVEEHLPELEDGLASAVGADADTRRLALFAPLLREAARRAEDVDLNRVVPSEVLWRGALRATAAGIALAMTLAVIWAPLSLAIRVSRAYLMPPNIEVVVVPGAVAVVAGEPVPVEARVVGLPFGVTLGEVTLEVDDPREGAVARLPMTAGADGRFRAEIPRVVHDLVYRVRASRHASRDFSVTARFPPAVERIDVHYEYPAFSGLAPRTDEDGGDIYAPAGTRVRLHVTTDRPVVSGSIALADGVRLDGTPLGPRELEVRVLVERDDAYRVALVDATGLSSRDGLEYFIRTLDDRPPDVRVLRPAGDQKVTRLEEVVIEARADDDYGISRFELVYGASGGAERIVPLGGGASTSTTGRHVLHIEDLDVQPGDFVTYYARAWDVGRGKRPTESRSDIFFLEIRPFNEEFEVVTSQAMMGGAAGAFEDLAARQKDIIIATWKLDRRAGAGKSADDIRALARAQGELRTRAAQMAGRMILGGLQADGQGRRGGARAPGDQATGEPRPPANPMLQAVEAMARAEAALDALETGEAVPHEMEALNQLLRAEADVRRRQVGRQQQSAQGGGRSGNQDLSALFDRELQRQQATNYEQPRSSTESRPEAEQSDALSRLRELARRQDDISRRQQELARRRDRLSEAEMKRQLERLTREQQALRREAEQLAQALGESGSTGGSAASGPSRQSGSGQRGGDIQRAAEAMGASAGDLRRARADEASARAGEAAERLRSAERRLQGTRPDERRRAAGDLQMEAQQLAEAQRRVGREAAAGEGTASTDDSSRRLAGEQARLAERAQRLGRATRELAEGADGADADALRRAIRELQRGQVDQRMQAAAEALRRDADAGGDASSEGRRPLGATSGEVADALDRAARQLGAAAGRDAETGRVAEDLARARDLRDRLDALGRDIERLGRDAESQGSGTASAAGQTRDGTPSSGQATTGAGGAGAGGGGEVGQLQAEFVRQLQQTEDLLERMRREDPVLSERLAGLDGWTPSRSAPGTEAFKQDFERWDSLRQGVSLALERVEAELATRLDANEARDRLEAGGDTRTPARYRRQVSEYYRSLAGERRVPTRPPGQP
jgi:hypothetical protein